MICSIAAIANSFMKQKIYSRALPDIKSDLLKRHLLQTFARHNGRLGARVVGGRSGREGGTERRRRGRGEREKQMTK